MSVAGAGNFVAAGVGGTSAADVETTRQQIARVVEDQLKVTDATDTTRTVEIFCAFCNGELRQHQSRPRVDLEWNNPIAVQIERFGWNTDGDRFFCGGACKRNYSLRMRDHGNKPLPAVERVADQSYAQRMYQTEPTTPAVPPSTAKAPAKPPQQPQPRR